MATESLRHLRVPNIAVLEYEARLSPAPVPEIQSSAIFVGLNSDGAISANFAENNDGEWAAVMGSELGDDCLRLLSLVKRAGDLVWKIRVQRDATDEPVYQAQVTMRNGNTLTFGASSVNDPDDDNAAPITFIRAGRKIASFQRAEVVGWLLLEE